MLTVNTKRCRHGDADANIVFLFALIDTVIFSKYYIQVSLLTNQNFYIVQNNKT